MALWIRAAGRDEEVDNKDEDEEDCDKEVVVLEDLGGAVMRAGAALRGAAPSAAATARRMEVISSGCGWGPVAMRLSGGPMLPAAACGLGVGLRSPPSGLNCAALLQYTRACASVLAGRNSSRGLHSGAVGNDTRVTGLCAVGVCGLVGGAAAACGLGLCVAGLLGLPGVGGVL